MTKGIYEWAVETRDAEGFHRSYWDDKSEAYDVGYTEATNSAVVDAVLRKWDETTKCYLVHEILKGCDE